MELGKRALGIAFGSVWGLTVLLGTWFILALGAQGDMISRLSTFYVGYSTSFVGGIIGLLYGFVTGFIGGFLIAWVYNMAYKSFSKPKTT